MDLDQSKWWISLKNSWIKDKGYEFDSFQMVLTPKKWLDKPRTVGYEFDSIQRVGKRLDKSAKVGYGFESIQTVGYL